MSLNEMLKNNDDRKIRVLIIDDDEQAVFSLKEHLSFFPEIEIKWSASKYKVRS